MKIKASRLAAGIAGVILIIVTALVTASCSNQLKDQGGIPQASPDYAVTIMNADNYPNITLVCFKGAGFMTTTRDYNPSTEVPEWDDFCKTKEPADGRVIPAPSASVAP